MLKEFFPSSLSSAIGHFGFNRGLPSFIILCSNCTEDNDTSGGIRKIQSTDVQKDIIYKEENGEKTPITQKIIQPKVEGAIITAKGANNASTKTNIIQAVEAVTGLATHKIQVFEMN